VLKASPAADVAVDVDEKKNKKKDKRG